MMVVGSQIPDYWSVVFNAWLAWFKSGACSHLSIR